MSAPSPCKGCTKRYIKCHAECPDYAEWRKEKDDMLRLAKRDKESWAYTKSNIMKIKKRRRRFWKGGNQEE